MSDPEAEPAAPAVKVYAMTVRVVEYISLKSRIVGPRTPVQTACGHERKKNGCLRVTSVTMAGFG